MHHESLKGWVECNTCQTVNNFNLDVTNAFIHTYFTQNQIIDLFHDAAKIHYYSENEGCCSYDFLIYILYLMSILSWCFLPEDNLYLTHDTLQKFTMPISTAIIKK